MRSAPPSDVIGSDPSVEHQPADKPKRDKKERKQKKLSSKHSAAELGAKHAKKLRKLHKLRKDVAALEVEIPELRAAWNVAAEREERGDDEESGEE